MTTIDTTPDTETQPTTVATPKVEPAAVITEQQVLLSSAAALAPAPSLTPAPARRWNVAAAVRAMFVAKPDKPKAAKHYPQRYSYLERSAMSREMDRL
jgi:hypothetical protein